jgi:hypothetical protein
MALKVRAFYRHPILGFGVQNWTGGEGRTFAGSVGNEAFGLVQVDKFTT